MELVLHSIAILFSLLVNTGSSSITTGMSPRSVLQYDTFFNSKHSDLEECYNISTIVNQQREQILVLGSLVDKSVLNKKDVDMALEIGKLYSMVKELQAENSKLKDLKLYLENDLQNSNKELLKEKDEHRESKKELKIEVNKLQELNTNLQNINKNLESDLKICKNSLLHEKNQHKINLDKCESEKIKEITLCKNKLEDVNKFNKERLDDKLTIIRQLELDKHSCTENLNKERVQCNQQTTAARNDCNTRLQEKDNFYKVTSEREISNIKSLHQREIDNLNNQIRLKENENTQNYAKLVSEQNLHTNLKELYGNVKNLFSKNVNCEIILGAGCIFFSTDTRTWDDAEITCIAMGMKLVSITSYKKNDAIMKRIRSMHGSSEHYHIGLHDREVEGRFDWVNGQTLGPGSFIAWRRGEPNGGEREKCGQIRHKDGWNDIPCHIVHHYICELDKKWLHDLIG